MKNSFSSFPFLVLALCLSHEICRASSSGQCPDLTDQTDSTPPRLRASASHSNREQAPEEETPATLQSIFQDSGFYELNGPHLQELMASKDPAEVSDILRVLPQLLPSLDPTKPYPRLFENVVTCPLGERDEIVSALVSLPSLKILDEESSQVFSTMLEIPVGPERTEVLSIVSQLFPKVKSTNEALQVLKEITTTPSTHRMHLELAKELPISIPISLIFLKLIPSIDERPQLVALTNQLLTPLEEALHAIPSSISITNPDKIVSSIQTQNLNVLTALIQVRNLEERARLVGWLKMHRSWETKIGSTNPLVSLIVNLNNLPPRNRYSPLVAAAFPLLQNLRSLPDTPPSPAPIIDALEDVDSATLATFVRTVSPILRGESNFRMVGAILHALHDMGIPELQAFTTGILPSIQRERNTVSLVHAKLNFPLEKRAALKNLPPEKQSSPLVAVALPLLQNLRGLPDTPLSSAPIIEALEAVDSTRLEPFIHAVASIVRGEGDFRNVGGILQSLYDMEDQELQEFLTLALLFTENQFNTIPLINALLEFPSEKRAALTEHAKEEFRLGSEEEQEEERLDIIRTLAFLPQDEWHSSAYEHVKTLICGDFIYAVKIIKNPVTAHAERLNFPVLIQALVGKEEGSEPHMVQNLIDIALLILRGRCALNDFISIIQSLHSMTIAERQTFVDFINPFIEGQTNTPLLVRALLDFPMEKRNTLSSFPLPYFTESTLEEERLETIHDLTPLPQETLPLIDIAPAILRGVGQLQDVREILQSLHSMTVAERQAFIDFIPPFMERQPNTISLVRALLDFPVEKRDALGDFALSHFTESTLEEERLVTVYTLSLLPQEEWENNVWKALDSLIVKTDSFYRSILLKYSAVPPEEYPELEILIQQLVEGQEMVVARKLESLIKTVTLLLRGTGNFRDVAMVIKSLRSMNTQGHQDFIRLVLPFIKGQRSTISLVKELIEFPLEKRADLARWFERRPINLANQQEQITTIRTMAPLTPLEWLRAESDSLIRLRDDRLRT